MAIHDGGDAGTSVSSFPAILRGRSDPSTAALFVMADDSIFRSSVLKDKKTLVCEWCVE